MTPPVTGSSERSRPNVVATLWRSTHPGPTVVVTTIALALGLSVGVDLDRLVVLTVSVFFGQVSIGLSNDVIDAPRDRIAGRTDKPLAREQAPIRVAWISAIVAVVVALALSALLGWGMAVAHAVFLACGWAYNAVLKSTVWSAACFAVGFGVFPSLATLALSHPHVAPLWAWIAGAALGTAVHFSNVLPDLEDDELTGVRGLPHRLGRRASAVVAYVALVVGAVVVRLGTDVDSTAGVIATWVLTAGVLVLAAWGLVVSLIREPRRLSFQLVMAGALLLTAEVVVASRLAA
ncbi:UbiA family prenyltransferase [Microbacterium rhizosphaerae]|uniref:UbiA family prenyltransferase n=1 Tax=Microbacterium rhizosphaerae TaxID=1678237 RepID=A0ABZ0SIU2_9MICO|nr:UbiA family prenyltransferase [Microbacterium rhizosphaerae]WPR88498.1 UbiA family prenyltransferase [Microbacterium rhizosphaerae]